MEPITLRRCVYRLVHADRNQPSPDAALMSKAVFSLWCYGLTFAVFLSDPCELSNKESVFLRQTVL